MLREKYCLIHLDIVNEMKSYLKQDNVASQPHTSLSCLN